MKKYSWMLTMALLWTATSPAAVEFDIDGATPGQWTMDLTAAKKLAAEQSLPILLDFSGSDWCGWCTIMEENIFTKPEWKSYAKDNLLTVLIDFPKDKSLVPEKYVKRNAALKSEYGVRGYPTFVVLDTDGTTELGRLRSGRDKTPDSFRAELENLFRFRPAVIERYCASLGEGDRKTYRGLIDELAARKMAQKEAEMEAAQVRSKVSQVKRDVGRLKKDMLTFRVAQLSEDERAIYEGLETQLEDVRQKRSDWLKTDPEQNEENRKKYNAMQAEISAVENKINQY